MSLERIVCVWLRKCKFIKQKMERQNLPPLDTDSKLLIWWCKYRGKWLDNTIYWENLKLQKMSQNHLFYTFVHISITWIPGVKYRFLDPTTYIFWYNRSGVQPRNMDFKQTAQVILMQVILEPSLKNINLKQSSYLRGKKDTCPFTFPHLLCI